MLNSEHHWYRPRFAVTTFFLLPLSWLFGILVLLRHFFYRIHLKKSYHFPVPVIVVGNISVGGTGKTPMVIWLAHFLQSKGFKPGIVSRGVGGKKQSQPRWITAGDDPHEVGDEAVLLAKRSGCPMVTCIDRVAAVRELLKQTDCNIVISDDGLQHYALRRDIEIAVIDGKRGLGNRCLLPAGPLREPPSRLKQVDFIVTQGQASLRGCEALSRGNPGEFAMHLRGDLVVSLVDKQMSKPLASFANKRVHAIAAIGNPERFFTLLKQYHLEVIEHPFLDHYLFKKEDVDFNDDWPIIMTEKDAVKCKIFTNAKHWYLPVEAEVDFQLGNELLTKLNLK